MKQKDMTKLDSEELVELLIDSLSECNTIVSMLGKKSQLDAADLRKVRTELMFARTKARKFAKTLDDMKKPVNSFKLMSSLAHQ
jgi:hypothetical protein